MLDIKITGLEALNNRIEEIAFNVSNIRNAQLKQPEVDALLSCIKAMETLIERLILAHEELAGGPTLASDEARHALNAAQMIKHQNNAFPFFDWVFPESTPESGRVTKLTRKASAKKGKRK